MKFIKIIRTNDHQSAPLFINTASICEIGARFDGHGCYINTVRAYHPIQNTKAEDLIDWVTDPKTDGMIFNVDGDATVVNPKDLEISNLKFALQNLLNSHRHLYQDAIPNVVPWEELETVKQAKHVLERR